MQRWAFRATFLAVMLFGLFLWQAPARGNPTPVSIPLRVGFYQNPPLIFSENDSPPQGLYADLLAYIAHQEGWQLTYVPCQFSACLDMLADRDLDLMTAIAFTPERAEQFGFPQEAVITNWGQVFTRHHATFDNILDLEDTDIAVLVGDIHYQALQEIVGSFGISVNFVEVNEYTEGFALVRDGEADGVLANRLVGMRFEREYDLVGSPIIFNPLKITFAVSEGDPQGLLPALDRHLAELKDNPSSPYFQSLYFWLGDSQVTPAPDWLVWAALIGGGLLLLGLGGNVFLQRRVAARTHALEAEIARREYITESLSQHRRELESLLETTRNITQHRGLDEVLLAIAENAITLLDANECFLFRLDEADNVLRPSHVLGEHTEETNRFTLKPGEGITGRCVAQNRPMLVNNAQDDPQAVQAPGTPRAPVEHVMVTPLVFGERITGALLVNRIDKPPFVEDNLNLLIGLAQQAATAIENARLVEELARHNQALEQAVIERTAELQAANERLSALSEMKDQFVANVSHELRTPITSLKLRRYLLAKHPDRQEEHLAVVKRELDRLENIVEDLLYLSRLDQDRVKMTPTTVNLNTLIRQYGSDRVPLAEEHRLSLTVTERDGLPLIQADERLLGQALSILLTNALNYTPPGGRIRLSTEIQDTNGQHWIGFSVSDTGMGIAQDEQQRLFERFYRGVVGRESGASGTGLGLSIAREIVDRHHGYIDVVSTGIPGEGSQFTVWLPVIEPAGSMPAVQPALSRS